MSHNHVLGQSITDGGDHINVDAEVRVGAIFEKTAVVTKLHQDYDFVGLRAT
jgi:hypothetical protein